MAARWIWPSDWRRLSWGAPRRRPSDGRSEPLRQQAVAAAPASKEDRVRRALETVLPLCLWRP